LSIIIGVDSMHLNKEKNYCLRHKFNTHTHTDREMNVLRLYT